MWLSNIPKPLVETIIVYESRFNSNPSPWLPKQFNIVLPPHPKDSKIKSIAQRIKYKNISSVPLPDAGFPAAR